MKIASNIYLFLIIAFGICVFISLKSSNPPIPLVEDFGNVKILAINEFSALYSESKSSSFFNSFADWKSYTHFLNSSSSSWSSFFIFSSSNPPPPFSLIAFWTQNLYPPNYSFYTTFKPASNCFLLASYCSLRHWLKAFQTCATGEGLTTKRCWDCI